MRRRRNVGIELVAGNDANAIMLPAFRVRRDLGVILGVIGMGDRESLSCCLVPVKLRTLQKTAITNQTCQELSMQQGLSSAKLNPSKGESPWVQRQTRLKGTTNEAIGKAKQGVGRSRRLRQIAGRRRRAGIKGKGQKAVGDAKEATRTPSTRQRPRPTRALIGFNRFRIKRPATRAGLFFFVQIWNRWPWSLIGSD